MYIYLHRHAIPCNTDNEAFTDNYYQNETNFGP